jgi:hypothetical protein
MDSMAVGQDGFRTAPELPCDERALALWRDEVEEARQALSISLNELRRRTDNFLTVSALATTMFAVLAPHSDAERSDVDGHADPLQGNGVQPETGGPAMAVGGATACADAEEHGPVIPPSITSPRAGTATAGLPFSFTATTSGTPVPSLSQKGVLPASLRFTDKGDGTATIAGTPNCTGLYHLSIRAKFGKGVTRYVVTQGFTLTIVSA